MNPNGRPVESLSLLLFLHGSCANTMENRKRAAGLKDNGGSPGKKQQVQNRPDFLRSFADQNAKQPQRELIERINASPGIRCGSVNGEILDQRSDGATEFASSQVEKWFTVAEEEHADACKKREELEACDEWDEGFGPDEDMIAGSTFGGSSTIQPKFSAEKRADVQRFIGALNVCYPVLLPELKCQQQSFPKGYLESGKNNCPLGERCNNWKRDHGLSPPYCRGANHDQGLFPTLEDLLKHLQDIGRCKRRSEDLRSGETQPAACPYHFAAHRFLYYLFSKNIPPDDLVVDGREASPDIGTFGVNTDNDNDNNN